MNNMWNTNKTWRYIVLIGGLLSRMTLFAQTDGTANLRVTLRDYNGSSTKHWTVAWVTTASGTFIKTLWKQGPTISSSQWNSHCAQWYAAKAGSTALDGYSSATASNYSGTNSPVILNWNGRDASNKLVNDGDYKFWVQYAEDSGQGPYTTGGLLWTKGPNQVTNTYPDQGVNFASLQVAWIPILPPPTAPSITSAPPPAAGTVGVPYNFTCVATGTTPITLTASGLPSGLKISEAGVIEGIPTFAGNFTGTITAANGTLPNATQAFAIAISVVPASLHPMLGSGNTLVLSGNGPPNGVFAVLVSTNLGPATDAWTPIATNTFDGSGVFSVTNFLDPAVPGSYYRLRIP